MQPRLRNIIYFCPNAQEPVGGIKVILRHSELINKIDYNNIRSSIVFPNDLNFNINWFKHAANIKRDMTFNEKTDLIILPEIWAYRFGTELLKLNIKYGIFVQGGYLIFNGADLGDLPKLKTVYKNANIILSISDDTTRGLELAFKLKAVEIFKAQYSIDSGVFFPSTKKENLITYMPAAFRCIHAM